MCKRVTFFSLLSSSFKFFLGYNLVLTLILTFAIYVSFLSKDTKECVETKVPRTGVKLGTLYFGHDADAEHYMSIKPKQKVTILPKIDYFQLRPLCPVNLPLITTVDVLGEV